MVFLITLFKITCRVPNPAPISKIESFVWGLITLTILFNKFVSDDLINRKKTEKLWLKDEIHRLENETGLSKRHS